LGNSLFGYVLLVLSAPLSQLLSFQYWFCAKFRSGYQWNDLFRWSLIIFDMFVKPNYADISTKTTGNCFLKTATGRLEMFMKRHTGSDKHPKCVEF